MQFIVTPFWWAVFGIGLVVIAAVTFVVFLKALWDYREKRDGLR